MGVTKKQLDAWARAGARGGKRVRRAKTRKSPRVVRLERDLRLARHDLQTVRSQLDDARACVNRAETDLGATSDDLFKSREEVKTFEKALDEAGARADRLAAIGRKTNDDAHALALLCLDLYEVIGLQSDPTVPDKTKAAKLASVAGRVHLLRPFV